MVVNRVWLRLGTAALVPLALAGCATNAIGLDRAGTMVAAGHTASEATERLMDKTRGLNREALIDIVAADPNCSLPRPAIASARDAAGIRFCRPGGYQPRRFAGDWELHRILESDFAPTLAVIRALAGYLDEVDAVVTREPLDIGADLAAAQSDLRVLFAAGAAVAGSGAALPALNPDQQAAVDGALALISTIADEQRRVEDLRAIESPANRTLFAETLASLAAANRRWMTEYGRQLSFRQTLFEDRLESLAAADAAKRRPAAEALLQVIEEREALPKLRVALDELSNKLGSAHLAYLDLLDHRGAKLTDDERAKRAKLQHDRVTGALKSLTSLIRAF